MTRIIVVGEGMVELRAGTTPGEWAIGHGGDTLNTAIHLARDGHDVGFLTALGVDPFSRDLRERWTHERLDPAFLLTDETRRPGLYAIANDPGGERHFTYWRGESAARQVFALPGAAAVVAAAEDADLLIFSLISLAILPDEGRDALLRLAAAVRARGGRVAFDTNYRPALWPDAATARQVHERARRACDIGLPTLEDEAALLGPADADVVTASWRAAGVANVVVKTGADGCVVDGVAVPPERRLAALDTSGAGDAFNAGYLGALVRGAASRDAAAAGHRLAAWVVMRRGAVPPRDAEAPYKAH